MRSPGLRVEVLDETWAVYSPLSGDTLQLNTEAAAIVDVLGDGPADLDQVASVLAEASGAMPSEVSSRLKEAWPHLLSVGFIQPV